MRPIDFDRIDQLYDLRILLETTAVSRVAAAAEKPEALHELEGRWLIPAAERLADAAEVGRLDEQFHAVLVAAAGNAEMARVHWDVTERIRIVRRLDFTRSNRIEATDREHAKILRGILQCRGEQTVLLLRSHVEQSKSEVRKIALHTLFEARGACA